MRPGLGSGDGPWLGITPPPLGGCLSLSPGVARIEKAPYLAMRYADFERSIISPSLKRVASHWNVARGDRLMPVWSDIKPACIASELPIIWYYSYDSEKDQFTGRLAGDRIIQMFNKEFRGQSLQDIQPPDVFPRVHELLRRVVIEPAVYRGSGRIFRQLHRVGNGERIILPLGNADGLGNGTLGATEYQYSRFTPEVSVELKIEAEQWFSLSAPR